MAQRLNYHGDSPMRLRIEELYYMKAKIDRDRKRETDEDTREALCLRSATEFLRGTNESYPG